MSQCQFASEILGAIRLPDSKYFRPVTIIDVHFDQLYLDAHAQELLSTASAMKTIRDFTDADLVDAVIDALRIRLGIG